MQGYFVNIKLIKIGLFLLPVLFLGCQRAADFDDEPSITLEEVQKHNNDSITLTIGYLDGDGDLGLGPEHDEPPYDSGKYSNNLIVKHFEKFDGAFHQTTKDPYPPQDDTIRYTFRFENLTPEGDSKAIKGEMDITLSDQLRVFTKNFPERTYGGEIMFRVFIYDRALNKSNEVSTEPIPFNK